MFDAGIQSLARVDANTENAWNDYSNRVKNFSIEKKTEDAFYAVKISG